MEQVNYSIWQNGMNKTIDLFKVKNKKNKNVKKKKSI